MFTTLASSTKHVVRRGLLWKIDFCTLKTDARYPRVFHLYSKTSQRKIAVFFKILSRMRFLTFLARDPGSFTRTLSSVPLMFCFVLVFRDNLGPFFVAFRWGTGKVGQMPHVLLPFPTKTPPLPHPSLPLNAEERKGLFSSPR